MSDDAAPRRARQTLPTVHVSIGKWSCSVRGPVRLVVPAVRDVAGRDFSIDWDNRRRELRLTLGHAHDLIAALQARGARVEVHGQIPEPALWESPVTGARDQP
jgi:hypothetical protein